MVEPATVQHVLSRAGGNPFLVGEVGRALASDGGRSGQHVVTLSVRAAITERMRQLGPAGRDVVRAVAVLATDVSVADLAAMVGREPVETLALLADAERAALLTPADEHGMWRFTHAIVGDAVRVGLSPGSASTCIARRPRFWRRSTPAALGSHIFDIAHHRAEAAIGADVRLAASWLERAAQRAMSQLAFEDAGLLLRRALSVAAAELKPRGAHQAAAAGWTCGQPRRQPLCPAAGLPRRGRPRARSRPARPACRGRARHGGDRNLAGVRGRHAQALP